MVFVISMFWLGFLLVASESCFESQKVSASCSCVVIKLDLFSNEFWFCFVCVMHMIWLATSVELFRFVYVFTSWFCKNSLQQPFICVLLCLNDDFTRFFGDYFQVLHGELNPNWAWVP